MERVVIAACRFQGAKRVNLGEVRAGVPVVAGDDVLSPVLVDVADRGRFERLVTDLQTIESGQRRLFTTLDFRERGGNAPETTDLAGERLPFRAVGRQDVAGEPRVVVGSRPRGGKPFQNRVCSVHRIQCQSRRLFQLARNGGDPGTWEIGRRSA